jgi:type IV secretion system protein VirD4
MNARTKLLLGAAWAIIVVPSLMMSTAIAGRFWFAPELGDPLVSKFYAPTDVIRWAREWGLTDGYRRQFLQGVALAFAPSALMLIGLGLRAISGPLSERSAIDASAAHFGTVAELKRHGAVTATGDGVVIGKHGAEILRVQGDQHVLVMGPSGSGKGVGHVVPTLLEHRGSMLVHDPKHELAQIVGRHRASLGPAWIIDPTNPHAHAYNPLLELRGGVHLHGDCQAAATLICHTGIASDPVWEDAATELLTALFLVAFEHGQPTLSHAHDLVLDVSQERAPATNNVFARQVLAAHAALESRVRSSVNFELRTRMSFMSDPTIRAATEQSEFRASDLFCGADPTTIFVTVPPAHQERLRPLLRLVVQVAMNAGLHDLHETVDGRRKERTVLLLFDEFPALRRMPFLETQLAVCRGYGIRCMLVCQDVEQIKRSYSERQAITANCGTIALMPGFSGGLSEVEKWGGWVLQAHRSRGRELLRPWTARSGEAEERAPLLNARELLADKDRVLIFRLGARPAFLERVHYYSEARWRGRYDSI